MGASRLHPDAEPGKSRLLTTCPADSTGPGASWQPGRCQDRDWGRCPPQASPPVPSLPLHSPFQSHTLPPLPQAPGNRNYIPGLLPCPPPPPQGGAAGKPAPNVPGGQGRPHPAPEGLCPPLREGPPSPQGSRGRGSIPASAQGQPWPFSKVACGPSKNRNSPVFPGTRWFLAPLICLKNMLLICCLLMPRTGNEPAAWARP